MDTDKPVETPTHIEKVIEPRRSSRVTLTPARYFNLHENVQELFVHGDNNQRDDPTTYEEAISDIDSSKWLEAMKFEMDSMSKKQVWDLVDPPEGIVPITNKWVFKRKIGTDGKVETCKARLVAKGYSQRMGVDYEATFSPVAILKSIKILLNIVAHYDYEAFRSWNRRFDDAVKSIGFIKNKDEPYVYKKGWLSKTFSMKDLGEATYILGIQIYKDRSKRLIGLSQDLYLDKVLKRFNMQDSRRGLLPVRYGIRLSKTMSSKTHEKREKMAEVPYASAIGSLMYAMLCTRPNITYVVCMTNKYQSNPRPDHWTAVKNILK
ncbi:hypothetical protein CRG98_039618 [Punica granatum]|uniref:Reverse transcriptase Ty1/copia-type domain-containing protein n=1 Tax=Punica granatum TaxID=22663 RepID=A0A2I0I7H9_PUNGR|nr:hypothetical protein CRG98_039618 [Punica granatum]